VIRPTKRGVGFVGGAVFLFLIGTNVQSGWLFLLASLLIGVVVTGLVMTPRMVRRVEVDRRAPEEAFAGGSIDVDLVVRNTSRRNLLSLTIEDPHLSPFVAFVPDLAARTAVTLRTQRVAIRRGIVDSSELTVSSAAPFGVTRARRKVPARGRTVVFPRTVPFQGLPVLISSTKPLESANVRARRGTGLDFLQVREYQLGDSMRHIHWASTARAGSLMVREFEQEVPRRVGVLIDTSADTAGPVSALDLCCSVAASVVEEAGHLGAPAMLAAAEAGEVRTPEFEDRLSALTWLAGVSAPGDMPLVRALEGAEHALGRIDTLVVALPAWAHNLEVPQIASGVGVTQLVFAVVDASSLPDPTATPLDTEASRELSAALASTGAATFHVDPEEDLATCLLAPLGS
jgi:uncharacterized protein (DUF58 family)